MPKLKHATKQMQQHGSDAALIALPDQQHANQQHTDSRLPFGIITRTDLLHAIALNQQPLNYPAQQVANSPVFCMCLRVIIYLMP